MYKEPNQYFSLISKGLQITKVFSDEKCTKGIYCA